MWLWIGQQQSGLLLHVGRGARRHETTDRVGRWAGPVPSRTGWGGGQDLYPPVGPGGQTQPWRAGPWGWRQAEARLGYLLSGGGGQSGLAQAQLTTAQVCTEAQHSTQAPRLLAGQGGSPTSHRPFPTQLISHRSGSTAAPGAGPAPGEQTRGSPGVGWSEPEAEAASRSWCSPAGCREARKLEKQMCKFKICGNFMEISMF